MLHDVTLMTTYVLITFRILILLVEYFNLSFDCGLNYIWYRQSEIHINIVIDLFQNRIKRSVYKKDNSISKKERKT